MSDGLNFHLRMTVQMITTPPTDPARAIRTVRVVFVVELAPLLVAGTALVEPVSEEVTVMNSVC